MKKKEAGGIGFMTILGLLFIALKLMGNITWSWIWVLAPFWIGTAVTVLFLILGGSFLRKL